jgi:hypothetical protein
MNGTDWAKLYAKMDARLRLKYEQLPNGEQVGKRPKAERLRGEASETRKRTLGFSLRESETGNPR